MDCNQIKIFINLEIIGEEDKYKKKNLFIFKKILKKFCNLVQPLAATKAIKPTFYYIVYDMIWWYDIKKIFPLISFFLVSKVIKKKI